MSKCIDDSGTCGIGGYCHKCPHKLSKTSSNKLIVDLVTEINICELLQEILEHQVANLGKPDSEFYTCYTYPHGEMPDWVDKAKKLVK